MKKGIQKKLFNFSLSIAFVLGVLAFLSSTNSLQVKSPGSLLRMHGGLGDVFDLKSIPDGYPDGRATAPYGAYATPYLSDARTISDALNLLERKVYGIPQFASHDEVKQASYLFILEHQAIGILKKLLVKSDANLSEFDRESLKSKCVRLYEDIRYHSERLYQSMVRRVDVALPGPNGSQIRIERKLKDGSTEVLYESNCRAESCTTQKQKEDFYQKRLQEYLASGGKESDLFELNLAAIPKLKSLTRVEYVERPDGSVWVTEGSAGHAVLAKGGAVKAAGQIVLIRNDEGRIEYMIISNASGTYKPDLYSVQLLAKRLRHTFGIPSDNVVVTEGEPLGSQTVKVLMKAAGVPKEKISDHVKKLESEGNELLRPHAGNVICNSILSSVAKGN